MTWLSFTLSSCIGITHISCVRYMTEIASYFDFERLDAFGIECACGETEISQFDVTCSVDEEVLWDKSECATPSVSERRSLTSGLRSR
jgi:hypothetical protein